jgi:hypothetical protein
VGFPSLKSRLVEWKPSGAAALAFRQMAIFPNRPLALGQYPWKQTRRATREDIERPMLRGARRLGFKFTLTMASYNLIRIPKRIAAAA